MRKRDFGGCLAAGLTAFFVLAGAILLFFGLFHWSALMKFLDLLAYILRPVFYGMVLAFLLLPIQRGIDRLLQSLTGSKQSGAGAQKGILFLSTMLSLVFAALVLYLLLHLVLPEVYRSLKGLVLAFPG